MLAEDYDNVTGGDPNRDTIDLAVVDTAAGGDRGHITDTAAGPLTEPEIRLRLRDRVENGLRVHRTAACGPSHPTNCGASRLSR